jgi:mannose-6-phosphate isomerase
MAASLRSPGLLRFVPILKEKVWGGRALERWGCALPPDAPIGESWELADLAVTSVSGGGGGSAISVVAEGPHEGRTIHDLLDDFGEAILGETPSGEGGAFPLLVKLLHAKTNLSVQVHPSPAYAATHADAHLKTETWFVLEAEPDAAIYAGLAPGADASDLPAAAAEGRLEPLLRRVPVRAGDCVHLPSGALHALGAGVVVAEVQTPSDTTYRLYDWGRTGRELHIEQTMACLDASAAPSPVRAPDAETGAFPLASTDAYRLEMLRTAAGERPLDLGGRALGLLCTGGSWRIESAGGDEPTRLDFARGDFALAPAALGRVTVVSDRPSEGLLIRVGQAR